MPTLPSGQIVEITSERARYHATRQRLRISRDTPHQQLYPLVDIIFLDPRQANRHPRAIFTGYTLGDRHWLCKWPPEDRRFFLDWLNRDGPTREIEAARRKLIYDDLPDRVESHDYPERLFSLLRQRIATMAMPTAEADHWRNTILKLKTCGVRQEEIDWSGIMHLLDEARRRDDTRVKREELLSRIDFSQMRLEMTTEWRRNLQRPLPFQETARSVTSRQARRWGIAIAAGERVLLRYQEPLLGYQVLLIKSGVGGTHPRWAPLTPYRTLLGDQPYPSAKQALLAASDDARQRFGFMGELRASDKYRFMTLHGGLDYREWLITLPDYPHSHFTPHFTERNLLLHVRTTLRHDVQGRELLHIEEIQSDWHQQAAKGKIRWRPGIPTAPFRKEWPLLALKLLLLHAVERKYHGISWTPGETQQQRFQCDSFTLARLYDKEIPRHLLNLSKPWGGSIDQAVIATRAPWLSPHRQGNAWSVHDRHGRFVTRHRFTLDQAMALSKRHGREIGLNVPFFAIPAGMAQKIREHGLPRFGELVVDKVKIPLCGIEGFCHGDSDICKKCKRQ